MQQTDIKECPLRAMADRLSRPKTTTPDVFSEYILEAANRANIAEWLNRMESAFAKPIAKSADERDHFAQEFKAAFTIADRGRDCLQNAPLELIDKKVIYYAEPEIAANTIDDEFTQQETAKQKMRRERREQARERTYLELKSGAIGGKFGGQYRTTMWSVNDQIKKNKDTANFLKYHIAVGQNGEKIDLTNIWERKMAEFNTVSQGMQQLALKDGMTLITATVSAPPEFHINPTGKDSINSWNGVLPDSLCDIWAKQWRNCRSSLLKHKIKLSGMWTRETHKDGTPHLNFLIYIPVGAEQEVEEKFNSYMDLDLANPSPNRIVIKKIAATDFHEAARAMRYAAKNFMCYAMKNIDANAPDIDLHSLSEQRMASAMQWRRWAFFGVPPLSEWRALRGLKSCAATPLLDDLWAAARKSNFADYVSLNGGLSARAKQRTIRSIYQQSESGKSKIITGVYDKSAMYTLQTKQIGYYSLAKLDIPNEKVTLSIMKPRLNQNLEKSPENPTNQRPQPYPSRNYDVLIS